MSALVPAQAPLPPNTVVAAQPIAGAKPLRRPAHERFARARVLMQPLVEAYREAGLGGENYVTDRGNAAKLDRRRDIRDRVTFLSRQDEEVVKAKRARLEGFWWGVHSADYADYFETVSEPILEPELDEDGKPTDKMIDSGRVRQYDRMRLFSELTPEQRLRIESLKWTEKGRPVLSVYTKADAHDRLCKMLGIGPVDRDDRGNEFSRLDDQSLFTEIAREAKELGVDVEFTFKANGSQAA